MNRVLPHDEAAFLHQPEYLLFQWSKSTLFFFLFSFKKIASKIDKHVMLSYLLLFNKRLNLIFFNSIQNSHVHARAKQTLWNFQHLHISTKKNLTSNHCLKLKCLGFSVLKCIVLTFYLHGIEASAAFAF